MKTALIVGITGQDGSYLAELLLAKGYTVHGIIRRASSFNTGRIDHIFDRLQLHYGDLLDPMSIRTVLSKARPDEVYNLAAQSHVKTSFDQPVYSASVVAIGALHVLEAVRDYRDSTGHEVRFYQASSSEMFGHPKTSDESFNEDTPFNPRSPYACSKCFAYFQSRNYREAYGMFAANGILFNHESPRRGETFVTRKITRAAARIKLGLQDTLHLGNLAAKRDWGFAGDYVEAMWLMLQADTPDDFVVATGSCMTVDAFGRMVFAHLGLDWSKHVIIDPKYYRPTDVEYLRGNPAKAQAVLGWEASTDAAELARMMADADLELAARECQQKSTSVNE